uniref:Cell division control protein n=1 Tax=Oryzias sinensis TaxID=183150 RepID=A0A8C7YEI9_9TELE
MPSTRSQGGSQPTLQFPRRKSCRVSQKTPLAPPSKPESFTPSQLSPRRPADPPLSPLRLPASPPKQQSSVQPLLSPRRPPLPTPPSSPALQTRLPLSPRKRTGQENGCNLGSDLQASPPKQSRPSPRKLGSDENCPASARRQLIPSSPRQPRRQETPTGSPVQHHKERRPPVARLFAENSRFQSVKQALHTAVPERLLSREAEQASIRRFLQEKVLQRRPGSLYISGAPGTGKTACLNCVLQEMKGELSGVQAVTVNCMSLRSSHAIFPLLADKLRAPGGQNGLQRFLTGSGPAVLLVLDEMDQLDSKAQDVLYTIFEWPFLPKSRLCLIGIANALDLTDRILPRLQARLHCRPLLLHFAPYSRDELTAIVKDRLAQVSGEGVLDASAVQFCARKVSAVSGDARKALDICRRAVEMVESDRRKKKLQPENESPGEADPPPKLQLKEDVWSKLRPSLFLSRPASRVGLPQVARVLSEVYGERMASQSADGESFPLQQKLLVCCLLLLVRSGKSRETSLGKLHEVYSRLCAQRQVSGAGQGECLSLCSLLESRGIFGLKKAKEARLTKVFLKIEEKEVENALKDRALLGAILAAGLPS